MDEVEFLGASGSLLSYNLYSYCEGNPINRIDLNGNFYIDMGTILIILNIALSYPTASLVLCMGLEKFKKIIVNLFVKILAKLISVCPSTLSFALSSLTMLIGLEIVANFASAVYECLMEGKNGIEIYIKKSKCGFPYKITMEAK